MRIRPFTKVSAVRTMSILENEILMKNHKIRHERQLTKITIFEFKDHYTKKWRKETFFNKRLTALANKVKYVSNNARIKLDKPRKRSSLDWKDLFLVSCHTSVWVDVIIARRKIDKRGRRLFVCCWKVPYINRFSISVSANAKFF